MPWFCVDRPIESHSMTTTALQSSFAHMISNTCEITFTTMMHPMLQITEKKISVVSNVMHYLDPATIWCGRNGLSIVKSNVLSFNGSMGHLLLATRFN